MQEERSLHCPTSLPNSHLVSQRMEKCTMINLLINNGKDFDDMPPSIDALYQHFPRACLQSAHIWSKLFQAVFNAKILIKWGWTRFNDIPVPVYVTKHIISKDMRELSRCSCKSKCMRSCGCKKYPVQPCMQLCGYQGLCKNNEKQQTT